MKKWNVVVIDQNKQEREFEVSGGDELSHHDAALAVREHLPGQTFIVKDVWEVQV